jgi:hypothetical protein
MYDHERVRHSRTGGGPPPAGTGGKPVIICAQHGTMRTGGPCTQCQATPKAGRQAELEAG